VETIALMKISIVDRFYQRSLDSTMEIIREDSSVVIIGAFTGITTGLVWSLLAISALIEPIEGESMVGLMLPIQDVVQIASPTAFFTIGAIRGVNSDRSTRANRVLQTGIASIMAGFVIGLAPGIYLRIVDGYAVLWILGSVASTAQFIFAIVTAPVFYVAATVIAANNRGRIELVRERLEL